LLTISTGQELDFRCTMSTIVAMCPYCRAGGVRAPAASIGASATCPKCHSSFTVMPSEDVPVRVGTARVVAAPASETTPNAVLADETEPSPVVPGVAGHKSSTEPQSAGKRRKKHTKYADVPVARVIAPPPEPEPEAPAEPEPPAVPEDQQFVFTETPAAPAPKPTPAPAEPEEATDYALVFALGALILVGPAVIASQLPYGRFIAAALALAGLAGGVAALGAEGRTRAMAAGAATLHALILLVVFFLPSVLDLEPWLGYPDEVKYGPFMIEHRSGQRQPITAETWIDAANGTWEYRDVRVMIVTARGGPVDLLGPKDAKRTTKESYFQLHVRVANSGVERQIDLSGWAAGDGAGGVQVTDAAGRPLALAAFEGQWQPDRGKPAGQLVPGQRSDVKFYFASPAVAGPVHVQLPGAALGLPEQTVKFQAGSAMFARPTIP
jgi:hypothetical protein